MQKALSGEQVSAIPVAPHTYGYYKFEHAGIITDYSDPTQETRAYSMRGRAMADVEARFYEAFRPDWIYLQSPISLGLGLRDSDPLHQDILEEMRKLESRQAIDTFVETAYPTKEQFLSSGMFDHLRILIQEYGRDVFVVFTHPAPSNSIFDPHGFLGFESGLQALVEKEKMVKYLVERCYERNAEFDRALAETGCHGHISGEAFISADIISPRLYEAVFFEAQREYFRAASQTGLRLLLAFWGNVNPLIDYINRLDIHGLMIEESKKAFVLEVGDIRRRLAENIALFGNVDSVGTLLRGTPEEVTEEVQRQIRVTRGKGAFIVRNGSPVAPRTPPENLKAMIAAARSWR